MSDLQMLYRLQELDLQIETQTAGLQEIESALGETEDLVNARAQVDSLRQLLHDQEQRLRELEWDADALSRQMTDDEQKLYSGKVHNPKELDGIRKDLEQRRTRRGGIEDRELQLMADVESTQSDLQRAKEELDRVQRVWEEGQRELANRQVAAGERLAELQASRSQQAVALGPANLSLYETLRREKRGRAVSKVERSTCLGCRIALPMGVVQRVRAGRDLVYCPSCGRILYA